MKSIEVTFPEAKLVGIKVRTNSKAESNLDTAQISPLVQKYFQDKIADKIPGKAPSRITYITYSEYENDYTGEYTCFMGEEVDNLDNIPEGLSTHIIPAQTYIKFTSETGPIPKIIVDSWTKIWQMKELNSKRSYVSDFEVYDSRSSDLSKAVLDIYIGVKNCYGKT